MIAINQKLDLQSKIVGKRVKAEILSVELKSGNDIFASRLATESEPSVKKILEKLKSISGL